MQTMNMESIKTFEAPPAAVTKPAADRAGGAFKDAVKKALGGKNDKTSEGRPVSANESAEGKVPEEAAEGIPEQAQGMTDGDKPVSDKLDSELQLGALAAKMSEANVTVVSLIPAEQAAQARETPNTQAQQQGSQVSQAEQIQGVQQVTQQMPEQVTQQMSQMSQTTQTPQSQDMPQAQNIPQVQNAPQTQQQAQGANQPVSNPQPVENVTETVSRQAQSAEASAPAAANVKQEALPKEAAVSTGGQQTDKAPAEKVEIAKSEPAAKEQVQQGAKQADVKADTAKEPAVKQETAQVKQEEVKNEAGGVTKQEAAKPEAEKICVKVGDGGKLDDSGKLASDVSDKIIAKMSEGKQLFEIELTPHELGKIMIKLVMQNGKAEIIMQCLNPKTQQLVMMNSDMIRNIVEDRTGMNTVVTVKEEAEAYNWTDDREDKGGRQEQDERKERQWRETETDIFLHQLRLGLMEAV